jgi:hypothetical protein
MHMTKAGQQKALYRALGSIAFAGTARVVLGAGKDPKADRCFLMAVKQNICPPSATLAYAIGTDQRLAWEADPVVGVNADAVLGGNAQAPDEDRDDAAEFLRELLADGAMPQTEVAKAGTGQSWSMSQLRRAMKRAGVKKVASPNAGRAAPRLSPNPFSCNVLRTREQLSVLRPVLESWMSVPAKPPKPKARPLLARARRYAIRDYRRHVSSQSGTR